MLSFLWPSPEVYVINLLIGVAVFFFFRWLLGKFIVDEKRRKSAVWGATIVVTPLIYVGLILAMLASWSYVPQRSFSQEKWFSDKELRHEMKADLIKNKVLEGKTKEEAADMLGKPTWGDTTNVWQYDMGWSSAGFGWKFHTLKITFENGQVVKVEQFEVVD
jgi:hypothetical protein